MPTTEALRPLHIFVVENHPDTLKYLQMYLESLGHTVSVAYSVEKALATFPGAGCDVLISDIGLPDGNGWELLTALTEAGHRPAYAIAMSGFGMGADTAHSLRAGYRHHLLKPFPPDELDALLAEAARER